LNTARNEAAVSPAAELPRYPFIFAIILMFWTWEFATLSYSQHLMDPSTDRRFLAPRLCVTGAAIVTSMLIAMVHRRFRGARFLLRFFVAFLLAVLGALAHTIINFEVFKYFINDPEMNSMSWVSHFPYFLPWFWSYAALSGFLMALLYGFELSERERRIAHLQSLTHDAQLRALRYQINPHFLFNTLNSIAALIARGNNPAAETMVEEIADFFRATLSIDPAADIPLGEEIRLQRLYLEIEQLRFPERLEVTTHIAEGTRDALVPSLIMQPLAENVVRHAVACSETRISLDIDSHLDGGRVEVSVRNSAPDQRSRPRPGTGVGLRNVEARLRARFGDAASFSAERQGDGSFLVKLGFPYEPAAADRSADL